MLTGTSASSYEERGNTDPQTQTQESQQEPTRWVLQPCLKTHRHRQLCMLPSRSVRLCRAPGWWGDPSHTEQHSPDLCRLRGASPHQDGARISQLVLAPQHTHTGETPRRSIVSLNFQPNRSTARVFLLLPADFCPACLHGRPQWGHSS